MNTPEYSFTLDVRSSEGAPYPVALMLRNGSVIDTLEVDHRPGLTASYQVALLVDYAEDWIKDAIAVDEAISAQEEK